jgi:hypothetical protein
MRENPIIAIKSVGAANHAYFACRKPDRVKSSSMNDGVSVCKRSKKSLLTCFDDLLRERKAILTGAHPSFSPKTLYNAHNARTRIRRRFLS